MAGRTVEIEVTSELAAYPRDVWAVASAATLAISWQARAWVD